jgi:hypothetical protein
MVDKRDFKKRGPKDEAIDAEFQVLEEPEGQTGPSPAEPEPKGGSMDRPVEETAAEAADDESRSDPEQPESAGREMASETGKRQRDKRPARKNGEDHVTMLLDRPLKGGLLSVAFDPLDLGMAAVSLEMVVPNEPVPCDIYLALYNREQKKVEMKLVCPQGGMFKPLWRDRMNKAKQSKLYVSLNDTRALHQYFQRYSGAIINNPLITRRAKGSTWCRRWPSSTCSSCSAPSWSSAMCTHMVDRSSEVVGRIARDPQILSNLSEVLKSDYSIYAHSVNVAMMSMAFGRYLNLHPSRIHSLGMGGLLHDIGMSRLPRAGAGKEGPLTRMSARPSTGIPNMGYDMLLSTSPRFPMTFCR